MRTRLAAVVPLVLGASLLLSATGCSDSPEGLVRKSRAHLTRTLDSLETIAANVSDQPLPSEDVTVPAGAPPVDLDDIGSYAYVGESNAQLFTVQDLLDPTGQSPAMHLSPCKATWQSVKAMVRAGAFGRPAEEAMQALRRFSNWRYAAVLRSRAVQAPALASQPLAGSVTDKGTRSTASFAGGSVEGDLLVYDLETAGFLGGFRIAARSSDTVSAASYGEAMTAERLQLEFDRDLTEQIKKAVARGLVERLPQDRVYMNGNLRQSLGSGTSKAPGP